MILYSENLGHTRTVTQQRPSNDPDGNALGSTPLQSSRIVAKDLSVSFGSKMALQDIDFSLPANSSLALVGANGSGKTTLLNVVAGLVKPTSGTLSVSDSARLAYVLQHHTSQQWLPITALEVLRMGRYKDRGLLGRLRSSDNDLIVAAAQEMDVQDLLHQQFSDLSGGQRQRILVAQALVQDPQILLLDEPITGLDIPSQQQILDLIDNGPAMNRTVVLSTHHLDEARHCQFVLLLAKKVIAFGPPDEVLNAGNLREAFGHRVLGDHSGHDHPTDLLVLDEHGHSH